MALSQDDVQQKCEEFLESLGVPGFIVFGWQKKKGKDAEMGVVMAAHEISPLVCAKGMSWAQYHVLNQQ